jgi:GNAT superfamily N-acetyltransferase
MQILLLSQARHHLPTIADWLHKDWGALAPWADVNAIKQRLEDRCGGQAFPTCLIAQSDAGALLGTASLKIRELEKHPNKTYWLGDEYVKSEHRGQGLGSLLTQAAVDLAFTHRAQEIFLYTPDSQALYGKLGWTVVGQEWVNDEHVTLMRIQPPWASDAGITLVA